MTDLEELTGRAWQAYRRVRADRSQLRQAVQLIRAVSFARDVMAGVRITEVDRRRVLELFTDTEPVPGPSRALWSEVKAPEADRLVDYMRGAGYL